MTEHVFRLPDGLYEKLKALATKTGQSPDHVLGEAIVRFLEDDADRRAIENYERERDAGTLATYPLDEVNAELALER